MSVNEESLHEAVQVQNAGKPLINRGVDFLSSVRFGVVLLIVLVVLSVIGMLIVQQNVNGFDSYFVSLTPAEREVYAALGLFDIYHSWYFNLLLLILSLNIVLASIDRFPTAWAYIARPKLTATRNWILNQKRSAEVDRVFASEDDAVIAVKEAFSGQGLSPVISDFETAVYAESPTGEKDFSSVEQVRQTVVFGQRGKWNRVGAYIVHIALLILFLGHFVALRTGFDADVRMIPGQSSDQIQMIEFDLDKKERFNVQLPFTIECLDIQQKLIDQAGSIDVNNTLDWLTKVKITDPSYGETTADISLNKPFSYRGYRFFQAQTIPVGNARTIDLKLTSQSDGSSTTLHIPRQGSVQLDDGTKVSFEEFLPDFTFNEDGNPDTRSGEYNNPAAVLNVVRPGQAPMRIFAFGGNIPDNIPIAAPKAGFKWRLEGFEKAPLAHILSIKYDPYNGAFIAWYFGGFGLIGALVFVFFFSHRRYWGSVDRDQNGRVRVTLGGDTNRNLTGFEEQFEKVRAVTEGRPVASNSEDQENGTSDL